MDGQQKSSAPLQVTSSDRIANLWSFQRGSSIGNSKQLGVYDNHSSDGCPRRNAQVPPDLGGLQKTFEDVSLHLEGRADIRLSDFV